MENDGKYREGIAILGVDQEKAFDRVELSYTLAILEEMGFGENFINIIKTMYSNINSAVMVNGFRGKKFKITRGMRQGCSLSMLLFVIG